MKDCVMCKIIQNEIPSYKIYEDDFVLAILDISQTTCGHTLVIPKEHTVSLLETNATIAQHLLSVTAELAKEITQKLHAPGCNVLTNAHKAAGQEVMHTHIHIIPRFENDSVKISLPSSVPSQEKLQDIWNILMKKQ